MTCLTEILEAIKLCNKEISDIKEYSIEIGSINMSGFIDRVQNVEGVSGDSLLSEPDLNTDIRAVDIRQQGWISFKDNSWLQKYYRYREYDEKWEYIECPALRI